MPNSGAMFLDVENIFVMGAQQQSRRKSSVKEPVTYTNRAITTFMQTMAKMNEAVLVPSRLRDIEVRDTDVNSMLSVNTDLYSYYQLLNQAKQDLIASSNIFARNTLNGSGQNSGRATPTTPLSRRSSFYGGSNGGGGGNSPSATSPINASGPFGRMTSSSSLMPPSQLERKLSNVNLNSSNHSNSSSQVTITPPLVHDGETSPDLAASVSLMLPTSNSSSPLSFMNRSLSLGSLLADSGVLSLNGSQDGASPQDERINQIAACFSHHLNALYTILEHFIQTAEYIVKRYQEETDGGGVF